MLALFKCPVTADRTASINAPWPFVQWGMDILRPFSIALGQQKFLLAIIDYFTKWIEAKPLAKITEPRMDESLLFNVLASIEPLS